jgi:hypothetical protein
VLKLPEQELAYFTWSIFETTRFNFVRGNWIKRKSSVTYFSSY